MCGEPVRCKRCGNTLSFAHYCGGLVGGTFCTWYCAYQLHKMTGCGVYKLIGCDYVEVVPPISSETA
jgi:hypothetical protein